MAARADDVDPFAGRNVTNLETEAALRRAVLEHMREVIGALRQVRNDLGMSVAPSVPGDALAAVAAEMDSRGAG